MIQTILIFLLVVLLAPSATYSDIDTSSIDKWSYEADYCENMVKKLWLNSTHYFQKTIYCSI